MNVLFASFCGGRYLTWPKCIYNNVNITHLTFYWRLIIFVVKCFFSNLTYYSVTTSMLNPASNCDLDFISRERHSNLANRGELYQISSYYVSWFIFWYDMQCFYGFFWSFLNSTYILRSYIKWHLMGSKLVCKQLRSKEMRPSCL